MPKKSNEKRQSVEKINQTDYRIGCFLSVIFRPSPSVTMTYRFASPVIGIRIEDETRFVGEGTIEDQREGDKGDDGRPHEPRRRSLMVTRKLLKNKTQKKREKYL